MNYEQHRDDFERAFYKEFGFIPTHFGNGYKESSANDAWDGYCWALADVAKQAAPVGRLSEPPEGWKLVPIEPTPEMRLAGARSSGSSLFKSGRIEPEPQDGPRTIELVKSILRVSDNAYAAMVAAAPTTPKDAS